MSRYIRVGDGVRMDKTMTSTVTPFFFSDNVRLDPAAASIAAPLNIIDVNDIRSC